MKSVSVKRRRAMPAAAISDVNSAVTELKFHARRLNHLTRSLMCHIEAGRVARPLLSPCNLQ